MTVICLGPCCIPVSALLPLLLLLISPIIRLLRKTPLAKYLPDPDAKNTRSPAKVCCSDASCKDEGEASKINGAGDVKVAKSMDHWEELKRSEPLLVADFTAGWCKPCQKMAPIFESLATEFKDAAVFVKVDIDELPEAFDGLSVPAFHVLRNGTKVGGFSGAAEGRLRSMVAEHCKKSS